MRTKLDGVYLSIVTALGLELACASPVSTDGSESSSGESATSADSADSSESADSVGDGDPGDGDPGDGDGDPGDGDPGDGDGDPTGADPLECENPTVIMQAGTETPSGFVSCDGGFIHRAEAVECLVPDPPPESPECAEGLGSCQTSADCQAQPHGSCVLDDWGECGCRYGCATDEDCGEGYACVCAGVFTGVASCVPAECTTSVDCDDGLCGLSTYQGVCDNSHELACTSPIDECHDDGDCEMLPCAGFPDGEPVPYYCTASGGEGYTCEQPPWCEGACGRPLIIDGEARVAAVVARRDWSHPLAIRRAPDQLALTPTTRAQLAAHWVRVAQFEHASIASFARFCAHLLALGAPPALIRGTRRALVDEIEHARLAFGLASAYAETPLGPDALAIDGAMSQDLDPRTIVEALILEACVGETLAAIEAREAAAWARDPTVAATLERIANDELRHARLGWQALRWMLERSDAPTRAAALARLEAAIGEARAASSTDGVWPALRVHGLLDDELRDQLRRCALSSVIEPCAAGLRQRFGLGKRPRARSPNA